jgi:hypothetical protein
MIFRFIIVYIIIITIFSGCISIQPVQEFSSYSRATFNCVNIVAKDYHYSCIRSNSYKPIDHHLSCVSEKEASDAILKIASILDAYSAALGSLASDELVNYNDDITKFTDELKKLPITKNIEEKKLDSIGNLAALIANAATFAYQQKKLTEFIKKSNESVLNVTSILSDIIENNYSQAIKIELSSWRVAYRRVERKERESRPLEWEKYSKEQMTQYANLTMKLSSAKELALCIRKIGETHDKLKQDSDNLSGKEVISYVRIFIDSAKPVIKDINDSISKK